MKLGFVISTFAVLVFITIIAVYSVPLGLRSSYKENFQTNNPVMNLKLSRANLAKEGFQNIPVNPVVIPPARPQGITTTTMKAGNTQPPTMQMNSQNNEMPSTMNIPPPMPTPTPQVTPPPNAAMMEENQATTPSMDMCGNMISPPMSMPNTVQGFENMNLVENQGSSYRKEMREGFKSNYAETCNYAKDKYQPMGAFDGVTLPTGNKVSSWRYTSPDESLLGAPFKVGDNELFIFKNNQCKPECCGSSFSCSGGCVCTTPEQRDYINGRGGNRTAPADD